MRAFFCVFILSHLLYVIGASSPTVAPLFSPLVPAAPEPAPMSDKARGKQPVAPSPTSENVQGKQPMSEKARGKQPVAPAPAPMSEKMQGKQPMSEKARGKQPAAPAPAPMSDKARGKQPASDPRRQPPSAPNIPQVPPTNLSQDQDVNTCMVIGDALQHLMSFGFSYEMSLEAVNRFGTNINRGAEWLLSEADNRRTTAQQRPHITGPNVPPPPVQQRSDPLTPKSRGEAIQQLFALGYDFSMCTEAVKRFGTDIDKATNWMRELGVIPGEAPKPAWRHQVGMRYKIGDTGSKGKAPAKPQGGARPQPEANSPGSNESSSSSKSAGKAPMLDPKTGKPIRHDSPIEPAPRPPQPRAPPPDTVPEQEADHNTVIATAIQSLVDMGFDFDLCMTAVDRVGADVQAAASWIMDNIDRPKKKLPPRQIGFPEFPHQLPGFPGAGGPLPPHIVQQLSGNSPARPQPQVPQPPPASPDDSHSRPITPNPPHPFPYVDPNNPTNQQASDVPPQDPIPPASNANTQTDEIISPSRSSSSGSSSAETAEELDSPGTPPGLADDQDEPSGGRLPEKDATETQVSTIQSHHLNYIFLFLFSLFITLHLYTNRKKQDEFQYVAYSEL